MIFCAASAVLPRNLQIHKIQRFKNFFLIQTHFFIIFRYISAVQNPFKILCFKLFPVFPDDFILSKLSLAVNCLQCSVQMFYRILYGLFEASCVLLKTIQPASATSEARI